jgi:hypothetical protein
MKKLAIIALFTFSGLACAGDLPDPRLTPGITTAAVTQENIQQTVCVKGYTKTVRPDSNYTNKLKKKQILQYGYDNQNPRDYEEDHLVALSLGGDPSDERNLWPQPRNSEWGAEKKDQLEFVMYKMLCHNEITLNKAQYSMAKNWIEAWKLYVPSHPQYRLPGNFD